jgi:hypothetical protein
MAVQTIADQPSPGPGKPTVTKVHGQPLDSPVHGHFSPWDGQPSPCLDQQPMARPPQSMTWPAKPMSSPPDHDQNRIWWAQPAVSTAHGQTSPVHDLKSTYHGWPCLRPAPVQPSPWPATMTNMAKPVHGEPTASQAYGLPWASNWPALVQPKPWPAHHYTSPCTAQPFGSTAHDQPCLWADMAILAQRQPLNSPAYGQHSPWPDQLISSPWPVQSMVIPPQGQLIPLPVHSKPNPQQAHGLASSADDLASKWQAQPMASPASSELTHG